MYPSVPKYDVLSQIKNRINDNKFVNSIDKCALIELAMLPLEFMPFTIDKNYNQKQGLLIGAPTSPCFAEIFIQRVEESHVYIMLNANGIWYGKSWLYICNNMTWCRRDIAKAKYYRWEQIVYYGKGIRRKFTVCGLNHKINWKERNNNKSI